MGWYPVTSNSVLFFFSSFIFKTMTDDVGAAVAVARVKTNAEKEDIAVQLMLEQNIKPKKALKIAGLQYEVGGKDYNRIVGKRRRGNKTKKRRRIEQVDTCANNLRTNTHTHEITYKLRTNTHT